MPGRTAREWTLRNPDKSAVRAICERTGLSPTAAAILVNRGIADPGDAERFLFGTLRDVASPFLMKDLEKAARRLVAAGARNEPLLIYADYDADGATGAACLSLFLKDVFPAMPVTIHQNHRIREGYGLRPDRLSAFAADGFRLVVTVDCGISDVEPIRHAASQGMEVIVTDHHLPGETVPQAFAVLDPHQKECGFPEKGLAGVGVAFALACGLRKLLRDAGAFAGEGEPILRRYLDLVALGTVADMAPLRGDNRLFVKAGLEEIRARPRPGISALLSVAGIAPEDASEYDLGFRIGPRLNAAGRVGEPGRSASILVSESAADAHRIASELQADNARRQREEETIYRGATDALAGSPPGPSAGAIVLADPDWHLGVLGIVASKLADRYALPTVLLRLEDGVAKGSCRTVGGFSLAEALAELSPLLSRFGGHAQAAGVALPEENLPAFRERFDALARRYREERAPVPRMSVDAEIPLSELSPRLMEEFSLLRPFGAGNEEPLLLARNVRVLRKGVFGPGGRHLRFEAADGEPRFDVEAFHRDGLPEEREGRVDLLFTPRVTVYRGRRSLRLLLRDVRPPGAGG